MLVPREDGGWLAYDDDRRIVVHGLTELEAAGKFADALAEMRAGGVGMSRSLVREWALAEAMLPPGGYLSLSGPNNVGHYNLAAWTGETRTVKSGEQYDMVTVNGGAIEMSVPFGRGYGPTPADALRDFRTQVRLRRRYEASAARSAVSGSTSTTTWTTSTTNPNGE